MVSKIFVTGSLPMYDSFVKLVSVEYVQKPMNA